MTDQTDSATTANASTGTVSFERNLMPVLKQYSGPMMWRFDLTSYDDVRASASIIWQRIQSTDDGERMPPPPFPPFDQQFIALFKQWMDSGYPP